MDAFVFNPIFLIPRATMQSFVVFVLAVLMSDLVSYHVVDSRIFQQVASEVIKQTPLGHPKQTIKFSCKAGDLDVEGRSACSAKALLIFLRLLSDLKSIRRVKTISLSLSITHAPSLETALDMLHCITQRDR